MFSKKKSKKLDISAPTNFQHRVHTGYDDKSNKFLGKAFKQGIQNTQLGTQTKIFLLASPSFLGSLNKG